MRDHLPTGIVREVMKDHVFMGAGHEHMYTNKHLAAMATQYAEEIIAGKKQDLAAAIEMSIQTEQG